MNFNASHGASATQAPPNPPEGGPHGAYYWQPHPQESAPGYPVPPPPRRNTEKKKLHWMAKVAIGIGIFVFSILALFVVVGLSIDSSQEESMGTPKVDDSAMELVFLTVMRESAPEYLATHGEAETVALAKSQCASIEGGSTVSEVAVELALSSTDPSGAGAAMGAGIGAFCPQHQAELDDFLSSIS